MPETSGSRGAGRVLLGAASSMSGGEAAAGDVMATVRIPPVLRPRTGGASEVDAAGDTVGEVLKTLAEVHPDTHEQLFGGDGELNRYVNVYLNDEDVRVLDGLDTAVSEADTVVILPAMAGGASQAAAAHRETIR